ncbi:MAG: carboxymuconolactone decarboxylase family protein [Candidatus Rokubacteria bacterium]|nr:carboxymuconolactone decarboxylase family protein [Candidatus Rokubacteria bacterium]
MADSDAHRKGQELRRQLMGEAHADRLDQTLLSDPVMKKFTDLVAETVWGTLWTRPGLDLKTRALVTVVAVATTGRTGPLAVMLRVARGQGWTEDELVEALLHLSGYVGVPVVREALLTAKEVFAEVRAGR